MIELMTRNTSTVNVPLDWSIHTSTMLALFSIIITFTGFRFFTNLNSLFEKVNSFILKTMEKMTKIKAYIDGGFNHPDLNIDPEPLFQYLT